MKQECAYDPGRDNTLFKRTEIKRVQAVSMFVKVYTSNDNHNNNYY